MNTGFPVRDLHYLKIRPSYTILNFIMKNFKNKKKNDVSGCHVIITFGSQKFK
jgi:hypothetical protein